MKFKTLLPSLLAAAAIAVSLTACETEKEDAPKLSDAQLKAQAKVSEADARATVMAKLPNCTIKEAELEQEHGKIIWSFDVSVPDGKVTEINVNAVTGEIVNMEKETPGKEAKEKDDDDKK